MKKVYLLPNLFTTGSLFCGMLGVTMILQGRLSDACWFILASALLDAFDGKIARLTRTESAFGVNYDSLADLVAFGVAPAMLMFNILCVGGNVKIASGVTTMYATCGALRLARFNVQRTREEKREFTGLPIPAAGVMVVSTYMVYERIGWTGDLTATLLSFMIVILSCLMVTKIPYPSHKNLDLERRKPFDYLVSIIVAVSIIIALLPYFAFLLFLASACYVTYGVGLAAIQRYRRTRSRDNAVGRAPGESDSKGPIHLER